MRLLSINCSFTGSTGTIMKGISELAESIGNDVYFAVPEIHGSHLRKNYRKEKSMFIYSSSVISKISHEVSKLIGIEGLINIYQTIKLCLFIKRKKIDTVHLHNLHSTYLNFPILFWFLKKNKLRVFWTFHDCWAFTGRCPHFVMAKCNKWKTGCFSCPYPKRDYPIVSVDNTCLAWKLKRKWFTGFTAMTIITPSKWLASYVQQSFFKNYDVKVIYSGIDLLLFKPSYGRFRLDYGIPNDCKVVLGVAAAWGVRKGLDVFVELANRLSSDYQIVLVGTNNQIDKSLPSSIISVHHTENPQQLAEIYTVADVFVNPTREEVLGLVNIEALACGTPVITFNSGGSPECVDNTCGVIVKADDIDDLEHQIEWVCLNKPFSREACLKRAKSFEKNEQYWKYVSLY